MRVCRVPEIDSRLIATEAVDERADEASVLADLEAFGIGAHLDRPAKGRTLGSRTGGR